MSLRTLVVVFSLLGGFPGLAQGQISCYRLGQYLTCNGPDRQSTTRTEISPDRGVITTEDDVIPYTIFPDESRERSRRLDRLLDDNRDERRRSREDHDEFLPLFLPRE